MAEYVAEVVAIERYNLSGVHVRYAIKNKATGEVVAYDALGFDFFGQGDQEDMDTARRIIDNHLQGHIKRIEAADRLVAQLATEYVGAVADSAAVSKQAAPGNKAV